MTSTESVPTPHDPVAHILTDTTTWLLDYLQITAPWPSAVWSSSAQPQHLSSLAMQTVLNSWADHLGFPGIVSSAVLCPVLFLPICHEHLAYKMCQQWSSCLALLPFSRERDELGQTAAQAANQLCKSELSLSHTGNCNWSCRSQPCITRLVTPVGAVVSSFWQPWAVWKKDDEGWTSSYIFSKVKRQEQGPWVTGHRKIWKSMRGSEQMMGATVLDISRLCVTDFWSKQREREVRVVCKLEEQSSGSSVCGRFGY